MGAYVQMSNNDDLKAAEEYLRGKVSFLMLKSDGQSRYLTECLEEAYLAGLEAGRKESKWIKCSERMPGEYANVLVAGREPRHLASIATYIFEEEKRKWCQREKEVLVLPTDNWMPLPDAPKGPEGEK